MTHLELFRFLAGHSPEAAAGFVTDMWCRPLRCLYNLDTTNLSFDEREEVIETRVEHKKELRQLYLWLRQQVEAEADGEFSTSLHNVERVLAEFASSDDWEAKRFVLDVTGWGEHGLAARQEDLLRDALSGRVKHLAKHLGWHDPLVR